MQFPGKIAAIGVLAALLTAPFAVAQQNTNEAAVLATLSDPAADKLVAEALSNAPELTAVRASIEAARRRVQPAGTMPDPSLSTTYQNDGRSISLGEAEGSFLGVMLSQQFPWPGKLALAERAADSESREAEFSLGRAAHSLESRVRNAWYDLLLAKEIDRLIEERRKTAAQIEETTRARYAAGLAVQQDVLRAQVELARIEESSSSQRALIASRIAELNRLLGRPVDAAADLHGSLPDVAPIPDSDALVSTAIANSHEVSAARQAIETGRLRVDIAKKNFNPDIVVSGGSMYRAGFEMGPMWQVGVGISLPIWSDRRQRNQLLEAQARVEEQTANAEVVRRELDALTRERIAQLKSANEIATLYRDKVVPLDELSLESALTSYQAGKVPFVTILDAVNTLYSDRATYLSRLADAAKWRVAIDEASLQPTSMSGGSSMPAAGITSMTSSASQSSSSTSNSTGSSMSSMR